MAIEQMICKNCANTGRGIGGICACPSGQRLRIQSPIEDFEPSAEEEAAAQAFFDKVRPDWRDLL